MTASRLALVIGGAGFIGSHLVERLLNDGTRGDRHRQHVDRPPPDLAHLASRENLRVEEADVNDVDAVAPFFHNVDWVFNLAALADIVPSIQHPTVYHRATSTVP